MDDFRLQFKGTDAFWDFPTWNTQQGRDWSTDFRYSIAGPPTMGFNGQRNTATYPFRFNLYSGSYTGPYAQENLRRAIANILGYSTVQANPGDQCARYLRRVMPLKDPDNLGMIAESIGPLTFSNNSGYYAQGAELDLPNFAEGAFEKIPLGREFNDGIVADNKGKFLYNYAFATVTFSQPYYRVITDASMLADPNFPGDERSRYMYTMEEPSFEYVNLPQAVLKWGSVGVPASIADKPLMNAGGLIRNIMSVKTYWFRVPATALILLIPRWQALLGTVNYLGSTPAVGFTLPIYGDIVEYPPQSLLFVPWRIKPRLSPLGFLEYDVELNWLYRGGAGNNGTAATWNTQIFVDGSYYPVGWDVGAGQIRDVYPKANHENAFAINDITLCGS